LAIGDISNPQPRGDESRPSQQSTRVKEALALTGLFFSQGFSFRLLLQILTEPSRVDGQGPFDSRIIFYSFSGEIPGIPSLLNENLTNPMDQTNPMDWIQRECTLAARPRGFHLVTQELLAALPEIREIEVGLLHLFLQHTSASLAINENADPDVRGDLERHFQQMVPERAPYYQHTLEGPDDMPAHIKSVLIGSALSLPVGQGRLRLGTWQGIYLCEHRQHGGRRHLVATLLGKKFPPG